MVGVVGGGGLNNLVKQNVSKDQMNQENQIVKSLT